MSSDDLKLKLIEEAKILEPYIIKIRRQIHMYPETMYEERKTATLIKEELQKIGYSTLDAAGTGVVAILKGEVEGKVVALRADIDALNIKEENTNKIYCSKNLGKMHACGHDAHTAMLLGAAKLIFKYKGYLKGTVILIFQPAEEGGGGGKRIIDEGYLDEVDRIFGMHVWRELPTGVIATRKGGALASADEFTISIEGKGGHAASPHLTIDPNSVLVDIYNAIQKIITREIDPFENVIITTPMFKGSDAHNVISPIAILRGTFRTMSNEVREYIMKRIVEIVQGYSAAWRCRGRVTFNDGDMIPYPPLVNHDEAVNEAVSILTVLDDVVEMKPSMGGEDFAFYLKEVKGAFIVLGIYNEEKEIVYPHHHPKFDVDEEILWKGTAIYALLGFYSSFT